MRNQDATEKGESQVNDFNVVTVPSFGDFVEETGAEGPERIARLVLGEKSRQSNGLPAVTVTLDLQALNGINGSDELVWLSKSVTIIGFRRNGAFKDPKKQARYEAMDDLERIVKERLEALGFEVRPGRYVLPEDLHPLNGVFDCTEWYRDDEGLPQVRPASEPSD